MIDNEKIEQWARRIVFFDWSGDRSDSWAVYNRCENGKRMMETDAQKENFTLEDVDKIRSAIVELVKENWKGNADNALPYYIGRVHYVFKK